MVAPLEHPSPICVLRIYAFADLRIYVIRKSVRVKVQRKRT